MNNPTTQTKNVLDRAAERLDEAGIAYRITRHQEGLVEKITTKDDGPTCRFCIQRVWEHRTDVFQHFGDEYLDTEYPQDDELAGLVDVWTHRVIALRSAGS